MVSVKIWEGVEQHKYDTVVELIPEGVVLNQQKDYSSDTDCIVLDTEHAIDIAFTILKELCPTLHETLEKLDDKG